MKINQLLNNSNDKAILAKNFYFAGTALVILINVLTFAIVGSGWNGWGANIDVTILRSFFNCFGHLSWLRVLQNSFFFLICGLYLERRTGSVKFFALTVALAFFASATVTANYFSAEWQGFLTVVYALLAYAAVDFLFSLRKKRTRRDMLLGVCMLAVVLAAMIFVWEDLGRYSGFVAGLVFALTIKIAGLSSNKSPALMGTPFTEGGANPPSLRDTPFIKGGIDEKADTVPLLPSRRSRRGGGVADGVENGDVTQLEQSSNKEKDRNTPNKIFNDGKEKNYFGKNYFYTVTGLVVTVIVLLFALGGNDWHLGVQVSGQGDWNAMLQFDPIVRTVLNTFAHQNWTHVLGNAAGLLVCGVYLERKLGSAKLLLFILSLVFFTCTVSTAATLSVDWVGFSGVLYLLYAFVIVDFLFYLRRRQKTRFNLNLGVIVCALIYALMCLSVDGYNWYPHGLLSNPAHYAGFAAGLFLGIVVQTVKVYERKNEVAETL